MNKSRSDEIDPRLVPLLEELLPAPAREPERAARARAQFLSETVSLRDERRLSLWTIFRQKEQLAMKIIMSLLVIAGMLLGGNATVSAAQNDLPNEPLYPLKLMSEDVNLWLVSDPAARIEILMRQAQTRTEEIAALAEENISPPAELRVRAQDRIQQALQLAASLEDPTATLLQIRAQLQTQEQLMRQLQDAACGECEPVVQETREMLQDQLRQIDSGRDRPQPSPNQNQNQLRITQTPVASEEPAAPQTLHTPALDGSGHQNGGNDPSAATPMPQNNSANQDGGVMQNNSDGSGSPQNGNDHGTGSGDEDGSGSGQGSGGQGGKP